MATAKQQRIDAKKRLAPESLMALAVISGKKETRDLARSDAWAQLRKDFRGEGRHDAGAVIATVRELCGIDGPMYSRGFSNISTLGVRGCRAIVEAVHGSEQVYALATLDKISKLRAKGEHASADALSMRLSSGDGFKATAAKIAEFDSRLCDTLAGLAQRYDALEQRAIDEAQAQAEAAEADKRQELGQRFTGDTGKFLRSCFGKNLVQWETDPSDDAVLICTVISLSKAQGADGMLSVRCGDVLGKAVRLQEVIIPSAQAAHPAASAALAKVLEQAEGHKAAAQAVGVTYEEGYV